MTGQQDDRALSMMNAAVSLALLIPLLLLMTAHRRDILDMGRRLNAKDKQIEDLQSRNQAARPGEWLDQPPVITVSEAQVYSFASGRADLTPEFTQYH